MLFSLREVGNSRNPFLRPVSSDWGEAQIAAQQWVERGGITKKPEPVAPAEKEKEVSIEQAWENFLTRAKARNLRPATIYKYELLNRQMKAFAMSRGIDRKS